MTGIAYVVTSGEYSDYRVKAVFTDRTQAEEYASLRAAADRYENYEVEEYRLFSPGDDLGRPGEVFYANYSIAEDRVVSGKDYGEPWTTDLDYPGPRPSVSHQSDWIRVRARTLEAAEKALNDRVAKFKAERAGL